jgi:hypothetical protein
LALRYGLAALALAAAGLVGMRSTRAAAPVCAAEPKPSVGAAIPADVCIPDGFDGVALDYFDDLSWRTFVALVWPAAPDTRGVAAAARPISASGPRVFETFKPLWEIFHDDGSAPEPAFDRYDAGTANACRAGVGFGEMVIGSASGIDDIGQAGIGALDPPIVAQNGRYVRTLTLFNRVAFDHIVRNRFYVRAELPAVPSPRPERPVVEFPIGSIAVKTAWIDTEGLPASLVRRMYTRPAIVKPPTNTSRAPGAAACARRTVGLLGFHIAHKTASRPQWVWSSFEQKDLVPPKWADWPGAYVLNDDGGAPMPETNPLSLVPLAPEPARPFNVTRDGAAPILTATELTTFGYQHALDGTPWQYYRLVVTQWPRMEGNQTLPIPPTRDGSIPNTFPGTGAFSAFANVTMETFDQKAVQLGCMSCHNRVRMTTDFMWSVSDHAHPSRLAAAPR